MKTSELEYELPEELIAQHPLERRDDSRLLVYDRTTGAVRHRSFRDLPEELPARALVVVNDTRVVPARLRLRRPGGGSAEVLLLEPLGGGVWEALARPSRRLRAGTVLLPDRSRGLSPGQAPRGPPARESTERQSAECPGEARAEPASSSGPDTSWGLSPCHVPPGQVELLERLGDGRWQIRLHGEPAGEAPLPPYIHERLDDAGRYQTVYADEAGSAAAPTAGLHFTGDLLGRLDVERVTLHVGLDTFRPVTEEWLEEHEIHSERYRVEEAAWERIRAAERVVAVGTTTTRVLETLARGGPLAGRTTLFVMPGFRFRRVDALVTNFHLPRSTLLALVMAFAGVDETRRLYRLAIDARYRFYSFGDAMLVL